MAKSKGTNGYVAELNRLVKAEYGGTIPTQLTVLIRKTAQDMLMMDRIGDELAESKSLTSLEVGSMAQQKTVVNPLIPYYDKMSARVTDDLYNLGLTARKQATKGEDAADKKVTDNIGSLLAEMKG